MSTIDRPSNPILCKNCIFFLSTADEHGGSTKYSKCRRRIKPEFLIDGNETIDDNFSFCSIERGSADLCGPTGKHFVSNPFDVDSQKILTITDESSSSNSRFIGILKSIIK